MKNTENVVKDSMRTSVHVVKLGKSQFYGTPAPCWDCIFNTNPVPIFGNGIKTWFWRTNMEKMKSLPELCDSRRRFGYYLANPEQIAAATLVQGLIPEKVKHVAVADFKALTKNKIPLAIRLGETNKWILDCFSVEEIINYEFYIMFIMVDTIVLSHSS